MVRKIKSVLKIKNIRQKEKNFIQKKKIRKLLIPVLNIKCIITNEKQIHSLLQSHGLERYPVHQFNRSLEV